MGALEAWWYLLTSVGPGLRAGRQSDTMFRFYVLQSLIEIGFFEFLQQPRSFGEILAKFDFIESEYTREVMETLVNDSNVLTMNGGQYQVSPVLSLPSLDAVLRKVDPRIRPFASLAEGMKDNILDRLREERVGIAELFERGEVSLVDRFNVLLGTGVYSKMRSGIFATASRQDLAWLHGKRLLDIGCGSGRETAELWLKFGGDIHITAIDPVPSMIDLARKNFPKLLDEIAPDHPPLTGDNRPVFDLASATTLPYEDDSFDATFWLHVLHWTSEPRRAIREAVRVVRPGGLHLGGQAFKPYANPYFNLVIRGHRNSYGFFWTDDYRRWFREQGVEITLVTPAGFMCARNRKDELPVPAPRE